MHGMAMTIAPLRSKCHSLFSPCAVANAHESSLLQMHRVSKLNSRTKFLYLALVSYNSQTRELQGDHSSLFLRLFTLTSNLLTEKKLETEYLSTYVKPCTASQLI